MLAKRFRLDMCGLLPRTDGELDAYRQSAEQVSMLLDEMKTGMTAPLRVRWLTG